MNLPRPFNLFAALIAVTGGAATLALGQSTSPMLFVGHNGNLEGSVASLRINCDGTLAFVHRVVTGVRAAGDPPVPGTNVYGISLSPNGRWLITSHATGISTFEQLTIIAVAPDGTLAISGAGYTDDSALDLQWVTDEYLAVTRTNIDDNGYVILYRFDPDVPSLTETDRIFTDGFCSSLAVHPTRQFVFAQDSTNRTITSLRVNADGTLDLVDVHDMGYYPLGLGVSPDGTKIYAGGGISGDSHAVVGAQINPNTGELSGMLGSPFYSPGVSPKQVVVSQELELAVVAHGSDATARTFTIDDESGTLTPTGHSFDVGIQGSLGTLAAYRDGLFITDNWDGPTGVYSFELGGSGELIQNGPLMPTQGVAPLDMAVWAAQSCPGDVDGNQLVDQADLGALLSSYDSCRGDAGFIPAADLNHDCCVTQQDLGVLLASYGQTCD